MTAGEATVEATTTEQRRAALEAIAAEVRACTRCRLSEGRTKAVPGEGHPDTEVLFVGEGPGQTEDAQGRFIETPAAQQGEPRAESDGVESAIVIVALALGLVVLAGAVGLAGWAVARRVG